MLKVCLKILFFSLVIAEALFFISPVLAAYEKFAPGEEVTISEFVYDDNFVATTTPCVLSVYKPPTGEFFVSSTMEIDASTGRHYKTFTPDSISGVWPANMACGTRGVDLAVLDKTFTVGYASVSTTAADALTTSTISEAVWGVQTSTLSTVGSIGREIANNLNSSISGVAASVWSDVGSIARTLTSRQIGANEYIAGVSSTYMVTQVASTEQAAGIWADVTSTRDNVTEIKSAQEDGWTVTLSNFEQTTGGEVYRAKLQILNYKSIPTDATTTPTLTIYDANGNPVDTVTNKAMDRDSAGTYHSYYTIPDEAIDGVWETEVSAVVEDGKTIKVNDYWEVEGSPAQVFINRISDDTISDISADITITNEGLSWYEYHYEWCVVSDSNDTCHGADTGSKRIESLKDMTTTLEIENVLTPGQYYFKLIVYYGTEKSGASKSFIAVNPPVVTCGNGSCSGGETCSTCPADCGVCNAGGGGGGGGAPAVTPVVTSTPPITTTCNGADFNHDKKVNSTDFSILLAFWKTAWPFKNVCVDTNNDKQVNSVDFSILMYQWGTKK